MKSLSQRDICTPLFIAALFTIAKICKQPRCPSTVEWIKKMWGVYGWILFTIKKKGNPDTCNYMDETYEHYAKWNKSDRER